MLAAGVGGGGESTSVSQNSGYRSLQEWTIHTLESGNSIYYGGTHAIRTQPIYLNAPTTPVDVILPMGTLFLAADAGPHGAYVWDSAVITVPSPSPNPAFYTKAF